jgi:hypothetical protein
MGILLSGLFYRPDQGWHLQGAHCIWRMLYLPPCHIFRIHKSPSHPPVALQIAEIPNLTPSTGGFKWFDFQDMPDKWL